MWMEIYGCFGKVLFDDNYGYLYVCSYKIYLNC